MIGVVAGGLLGLLDGLSAWFSPEARPTLIPIIAGSTVKGVATGLIAGLVANRKQSLTAGVVAGVVVGLVLSAVVAIGQGDHYLEIVLPGMLVGALTGLITQRYSPGGAKAAALFTLISMTVVTAVAQSSPPDNFAPLAPLLGKWQGTSEGQPGNGTVEREYDRALGSRFVRVRNRSTYPPQEKNPKGEKHEDEGFFSFDRARKQIVLRQFHVEGFVNTYVQDADAKPGTLSFTSESIENIPAGWRARETYVFHGAGEFEEIFELSEPGKPFAVYSRTLLKRVK